MSVDNKSANNKSTEDVRASLIFDALQCSPPSVWFTRLDQRLRFVIVVGVGTLGVALSLIQKIYSQHHSVDEEKILEKVQS